MQAVDDADARLQVIRARTAAALDGHWVGDPAFDALRIVVAETRMPHRLVWDVVEGFALDAAGWRPRSEADLLQYCYHVAGAVGCMMAVVMGVSPDAAAVLDRACDLGLAFQLANIARDVGEDAAAGRCYLPEDWLADAGIARDRLMDDREKLAAVARRLTGRAAEYEAQARAGTPALSFRSAWAVLAAAGIYGDIARKVAQRGPAAWDSRVTVSAAEKLAWIVRSAMQAFGRKRRYANANIMNQIWERPR